ncbi:MMPL family transporter [Weissella diestrammenae]|uniref:MMPL family transporter n=1 Tax=Weissella diestrammenae TaxID=1162633 RepID=A0A7G9T7C8_9LACO|nr:MMPL family transporter [Weissella diestrammenae]MCM0582016.1 MMPL family transporter [Weissella diestrammenae]QNN76003.1 MMPL family transporter [Weissella diestrammenae]
MLRNLIKWLVWLIVAVFALTVILPVLLTVIGIGFHLAIVVIAVILLLFLVLIGIGAIWAFIFLRRLRKNMKAAEERGEAYTFNTQHTTFHFNDDDAFVNDNQFHENGIKDVTPKD